MSNDVAINVFASLGYAGADREDTYYIDRDEWDAMDDGEREYYCLELAEEHANNYLDYWYEVEED